MHLGARFESYRRLVAEWMLIALLLLTFSAIATGRDWLTSINDQLFDLAISFAQRPVPEDIVIVGIDDQSISEIGKWPWRRDVHAALVDILTRGGARAIGLDLLLTEPDKDANADLALSESMRRSGKVVLPLFRKAGPDRTWNDVAPIPQFAQAAAGLGHIEANIDADGVMRGYERYAGDTAIPHMAISILNVAAQSTSSGASPITHVTIASNHAAASKPEEIRRIQFIGPSGSVATLSYADVLKGRFPAAGFKGKIVLVGALATGMGDSYSVPATRGRGPMAGVEIIANILDGERSKRSITPFDPLGAIIASALLPLIVMLLMVRLPNKIAVLMVGATVLATLAAVAVMLQVFGKWWPPAGALIAIALAYPLWSWRCLDAAQTLIDKELARVTVQSGQVALAPSRHSLIGSMERIRALRTRLDDAQHQREETLRFISHDLRAPLASLITLIESVAARYRSDHGDPWFGAMRSNADRALAMADDFLRLARAEAINQQNFVGCCLLAVVDEAIDEFWPQANTKGVTLARDFTVANSEALMVGEAGLLHRAFANLLSNAIRHSPPNSTIRIGLQPDGDFWLATVADAGPGIPERHLHNVLGRFESLSSSAPVGAEGTGLGLLIVRTVIDRHGGTIHVSSEAGQGTTFALRLPRALNSMY